MDAKVEALIRKHLGDKAIPPKKTIKTSKPAKRAVAAQTSSVAHLRTSHPVRQAIAKPVEVPQPQAKGISFPIDLDVFKQAIQTVAYCLTDDGRAFLNAVLIEGGPGVLAATGIDGNAVAHAEFEYKHPFEFKITVPAAYFDEINSLQAPAKISSYIKDQWGDLEYSIEDASGKVVSVEIPSTATVPEWQHLVPRDNFDEASFSIQANRLANLIKVCKRENGELRVPIAFTFNPDGTLNIERGWLHSSDKLDRQILTTVPYNQSPYNKTNPVVVGIDKKLLLRALKQYGKETVVLKLSDPLTALLLALESDPTSRFDLIMPMRINR